MKTTKYLIILLFLILLGTGHALYSQTGCTCDAGCSSRTTISAPFSTGGAGEFCWDSKDLGNYIQSWGVEVLEVNGVDYTNMYVYTSEITRDTDGTYYVYYLAGENGHFEATGESGITNCKSKWCACGQYDEWTDNGFFINNNMWGSTDGEQCIWAQAYNNWGVTSDFPNTGGVKSYPNVGKNLDMAITEIGSCVSSFNVTVPVAGSYCTSYDIWVPSEVMIWMNWHGEVGPIAESWNDDGTPVITEADVTVGGHTWNVYRGGSNVISFLRRDGGITSGTVDIKAILAWIYAKGWIDDGTVGNLQFGFEITSAAGGLDFTVNDFSLEYSGGGSNITPFPTDSPQETETPQPTATPVPTTDLGDVNSDGSINIVDALLVAQYYVGLNPSNFNVNAADTNCDGSVNIVDALLIAQYYVGLVNQFC